MDKYQTYFIIGGAAVVLIIGLMVMGIIPGLLTAAEKGGSFSMWGLESDASWKLIFKTFNDARGKTAEIKIGYTQKNERSVETDLINTLANRLSPDLVVFPSTYMTRQKDKFRTAPIGTITDTELKGNYSDAISFYRANTSGGPSVTGIPIYGDALVLYSNSDILSKHLIPLPPETWDDFLDMAVKTTEKDRAGNIVVSGAAMGRAINIANADHIMEALFLQFGEPIIDTAGKVVIGQPQNTTDPVVKNPAVSALQFFLDFGNPKKTSYTWTPTLPEARALFLSGRLTFYIGFMSEYADMRAQNPHLDIRVSMLPQLAKAPRPITTGTMYALMVPRSAVNAVQAWTFATAMKNQQYSEALSGTIGLMPPLRGTVVKYKSDAIRSVFANSVFAMKLWQNPAPEKTRSIFKSMIENAALSRDSTTGVLNDARARLREAQF